MWQRVHAQTPPFHAAASWIVVVGVGVGVVPLPNVPADGVDIDGFLGEMGDAEGVSSVWKAKGKESVVAVAVAVAVEYNQNE